MENRHAYLWAVRVSTPVITQVLAGENVAGREAQLKMCCRSGRGFNSDPKTRSSFSSFDTDQGRSGMYRVLSHISFNFYRDAAAVWRGDFCPSVRLSVRHTRGL